MGEHDAIDRGLAAVRADLAALAESEPFRMGTAYVDRFGTGGLMVSVASDAEDLEALIVAMYGGVVRVQRLDARFGIIRPMARTPQMNPLEIVTDRPPSFLDMAIDSPPVVAPQSAQFCRLRVTNRDRVVHEMEQGVDVWLVEPSTTNVVGGQMGGGKVAMSVKVSLPPDDEVQFRLPFTTAGLGKFIGGFIPSGAYDLLCSVEFYVDADRPKLSRFTTPRNPIVVRA